VGAPDVRHRLQRGCAEAASLQPPGDLDHHRAQRVPAAFVDAAHDRVVDPVREVVERPVPANREAPRAGEDLPVVDQVELELGELLGEPAPVLVQHVAVVVVRGERVVGRLPRGLGEVGPFCDREDVHPTWSR